MNIYLKIKIKSLAAESTLIRQEEKKVSTTARQRKRMARALALDSIPAGATGKTRSPLTDAQRLRIEKKLTHARNQLANQRAQTAFIGLRDHRKNEVRSHARSAYLAYGFLRGRRYNQIENKAFSEPDWMEVQRLVEKFSEEGSQTWGNLFKEFKESAAFELYERD